MFAYSHFYGGSRDDAPAYIAALFSEDRGRLGRMRWSGSQCVEKRNEREPFCVFSQESSVYFIWRGNPEQI